MNNNYTNDNTLNKKKSNKKLLLFVVIVFILLISGSYAIWNKVIIGNDNTIDSGYTNIRLTEGDDIINLQDALPESDAKGITEDPFEFAITTKSTVKKEVLYTIKIEKLENSIGFLPLTDDQMKIYLTDSSDNILLGPIKISELEDYILYSKNNVHPNSNEVVDKYKLRLWIDKDTVATSWTDISKYQYKFRLNVKAEPSIEYTLTLNPNGGTYNGATTNTLINKIRYSTTLINNNSTKEGRVFGGWKTSNLTPTKIEGTFKNNDGKIKYYDQNDLNKQYLINSINANKPSIYNNSSNGTVTITNIEDSTSSTNYSARIVTNGTASPNTGGFVNYIESSAGAVYYHKIVAKIPEGYNIQLASNSRGVGSDQYWLTDQAGTGEWKTYVNVTYCGYAGIFSGFGHTYLVSSNISTYPETNVTWYINESTMYKQANNLSDLQSSSAIYTHTNNATYTARWGFGGAVTYFNPNGGTFDTNNVKSSNGYGSPSVTSAYRTYYYASNYGTFPSNNSYNWTPDNRVTSRTGYTFNGWNNKADGTGINLFNNDGTLNASVTINSTNISNASKDWTDYTENQTVYAKWSAHTYTVSYDANTGTGTTASSTHTYGISKVLTTNGFTKTGYTFMGWSTTQNGSVIYTNNQSVTNLTITNNDTITLYAVWEDTTAPANPTITRSDYNTFTYTTTDTVGVTGYKITTTSTKPLATDTGWTTTTTYDIPQSASTYYIWAKDAAGNVSASKSISTYLVTTNEGTGTTLTTKLESSTGTNLTNNTYVLSGTPVYIASQLQAHYNTLILTAGGTSFTSGNIKTITSNTNITSSATIDSFTVSATVLNGTITSTTQLTIIYNQSGTFNTLPTTGYNPDNPTITCTNNQTNTYENGTVTVGPVTENTTCSITYEKLTYQITYIDNPPENTTTSGIPSNQIKTYGDNININTTKPENTENVFLGWTTTDDEITYDETTSTVSGTWYDPGATYTENENLTLYARWFDLNSLEENITSSVHSGDISLKTAVTLASGSVSSWSTGSTATSVAADTGYVRIGNGFPLWSVNNGSLYAYKAYNGNYEWRNAANSAISSNKQASVLQVRERTSTTNTGTLDERILAMQNEIEGCLSYLAADGDLIVKNTSQTVSVAKLSNKTASIAADTGYTAVALMGYDLDGTGISYIRIYGVYTASIAVNNSHNSKTYSPTVKLYLLETKQKTVGTATEPVYNTQPTEGQKYYEALIKLYNTERTKLFKSSDCGGASVVMAQTSTSERSGQITGHSRVVGTTGYRFYNSSSGTGESYTIITALRMNGDTTAYVQHTGVYRSSTSTRYSPSAVNCEATAFVIDKH